MEDNILIDKLQALKPRIPLGESQKKNLHKELLSYCKVTKPLPSVKPTHLGKIILGVSIVLVGTLIYSVNRHPTIPSIQTKGEVKSVYTREVPEPSLDPTSIPLQSFLPASPSLPPPTPIASATPAPTNLPTSIPTSAPTTIPTILPTTTPTSTPVPPKICNGTLYALDCQNHKIYSIDKTTAVSTESGSLIVDSFASAQNTVNKGIYYFQSNENGALYYYSLETNTNTKIGNSNIDQTITRAAFGNTNILYVLTSSHELFSVATESAQAVSLGRVTGLGNGGGDIVFDDNNILYLFDSTGAFYRINRDTLVAELLRSTNLTNATGIAFENNTFYIVIQRTSSLSDIYSLTLDISIAPYLIGSVPFSGNDLSSCH